MLTLQYACSVMYYRYSMCLPTKTPTPTTSMCVFVCSTYILAHTVHTWKPPHFHNKAITHQTRKNNKEERERIKEKW